MSAMTAEWSKEFPVPYDSSEVEPTVFKAILAAHSELQTGQMFEIRCMRPPAAGRVDFGRRLRTCYEAAKEWGICAYHTPEMDGLPEVPRVPYRDARQIDGYYGLICRKAVPPFKVAIG